MAEALAAAHDKGIIHRDIKPDNVFVKPGPPPSAKLVDFGIAKLAGEFHAGLKNRTQTGIVMGTPLYMSPEQCRGAGTVDYRTDIYSLGCLLFEMLAGRPPFQHEGAGELVAAHLTQAPPRLGSLLPRCRRRWTSWWRPCSARRWPIARRPCARWSSNWAPRRSRPDHPRPPPHRRLPSRHPPAPRCSRR